MLGYKLNNYHRYPAGYCRSQKAHTIRPHQSLLGVHPDGRPSHAPPQSLCHCSSDVPFICRSPLGDSLPGFARKTVKLSSVIPGYILHLFHFCCCDKAPQTQRNLGEAGFIISARNPILQSVIVGHQGRSSKQLVIAHLQSRATRTVCMHVRLCSAGFPSSLT